MSLIDDLKTINNPGLPIVPVKADHDNIARANVATGFVEAGRIILPEFGEWVYDFVEELAKAGATAEYMDETDAFSHGIASFKKRPKKLLNLPCKASGDPAIHPLENQTNLLKGWRAHGPLCHVCGRGHPRSPPDKCS
jgi:hypothetical protein